MPSGETSMRLLDVPAKASGDGHVITRPNNRYLTRLPAIQQLPNSPEPQA